MAQQYTVAAGDTLAAIAKKTLGDASKWRDLRGYAGDPRKLPVGTVLEYGTPAAASAASGQSSPAGSAPAGSQGSAGQITAEQKNAPRKFTGNDDEIDSINTKEDARAWVNANQEADIAAAEKAAEPEIRRSAAMLAGIGEQKTQAEALRSSLVPEKKPEIPNYQKSYEDLLAQYGVGDLESQLNDIHAEELAVEDRYRQAEETEALKPVAMSVIAGRKQEWQRMKQDEMDAIARRKTAVSDSLNTKYSVVNNLMTLKQQDYTAASADYDRQFNQNVALNNAVSGLRQEQKTDEQRAKDDARASLTIITNALSSGNVKEVSSEQQATISKLELQAGLPAGFTQQMLVTNPKAEIVTTNSWQGADGMENLSVVTRNKDGSLAVQNMQLGKGKMATGTSTGEKAKKQALADMQTELDNIALGASDYGNIPEWAAPYLVKKYARVKEVDENGVETGNYLRQETGEYESKNITQADADKINGVQEDMRRREADNAAAGFNPEDVNAVAAQIGEDLNSGVSTYEIKRGALAVGVSEDVFGRAMARALGSRWASGGLK